MARQVAGQSHVSADSARPVITDPVIASTKAAGAISSPPIPLIRSSVADASRRRVMRPATTIVPVMNSKVSARCAVVATTEADTPALIRARAPPVRSHAGPGGG